MRKLITMTALLMTCLTPISAKTSIVNPLNHHGEGEHEPHPGHGGETLKVGESAVLWYVHMEDKGKIKIHLFEKDGKTPKKIDKAPRINLSTSSGRKQVKTETIKPDEQDKSSQFEAVSDHLKGHIHGAISIKVDGKSYQLKLIDHHH